jgi:hypothetical protein
MLIFHMCTPPTGETKICKMKEFVDSRYSKEWLQAERERVAVKAKGE